jgi:hypothetical protein
MPRRGSKCRNRQLKIASSRSRAARGGELDDPFGDGRGGAGEAHPVGIVALHPSAPGEASLRYGAFDTAATAGSRASLSDPWKALFQRVFSRYNRVLNPL